MRKGKFIPNGVLLQEHEYDTVLFLVEHGYDIALIPKSNKEGEQTPDVWMEGLMWEMKSPKGQGKYLIQNTLHRAARQSENVVVDLRRIKIHHTKCIRELEKTFIDLRRLRRLRIITKARKLIDFVKG